MSEYQLVLVDDLLTDYETQRPLDVVFEGQGLVDLQASGLLTKIVQLSWINNSALFTRESSTTRDPSNKQLLGNTNVF